MTLRVCLDCTTAFAVGVLRCPHCGSERHAEQGTAAALGVHSSTSFEEDTMPKITRHGGASDRHDLQVNEGGEQSSAGSSGETSSAKPSTTPEKSSSGRRSRAPKTGSRSRRAQTESSSAASTDGAQADGTSATDSADGGGDA